MLLYHLLFVARHLLHTNMILQQTHKALYAAFDVYPSAKGAATHIYHNAQTLFDWKEGGWLSVVGNEKLLDYQQEGNVEITRFSEQIPNYLVRGQAYSQHLYDLLETQPRLEICHFRDHWSGVPVLMHKQHQNRSYQTVYEVNGLPSIELPYRYPALSARTLEKMKNLEQLCYQQADFVITPSEVIKNNLINLGVAQKKITVITNGAEVPNTFGKPVHPPKGRYVIYFGALQPWQGFDVLLKAMVYLADYDDLSLVVCASTKQKKARFYHKIVEKLGLTNRVIWQYQLPKRTLYDWVHGAEFSLAPLKECSRNLEQGCCPLKILESMAVGTPVVASDLPVVKEIISDASLGKLVRADRPAELARAMRILLDYPHLRQQMSEAGKAHIKAHFTWQQKRQELSAFYSRIVV